MVFFGQKGVGKQFCEKNKKNSKIKKNIFQKTIRKYQNMLRKLALLTVFTTTSANDAINGAFKNGQIYKIWPKNDLSTQNFKQKV